MDVLARNNVRVAGDGDTTLVFLHGFGCDQNMWRLLAPSYARRSTVEVVDDDVGHCPHLSSPSACASATDEFLAAIGA